VLNVLNRPVCQGMAETSLPCAVCAKEAPMRCGGCKRAFYCCKEHQKQDWKLHKKLCKELAAQAARKEENEAKLQVAMEEIEKVRKELQQANLQAEAARMKAELASQEVNKLFDDKEKAENDLKKAGAEVDGTFQSAVETLKEEGDIPTA
jgi:SMC interacting uncharacterized protein involved in chromosome segregation